MLNFKDDFKEFEEPIIIFKKGEGYRDHDNGGKWIDGEPVEVKVDAIVTQLTTNDLDSNIKYDEGGYYTLSDIKIYIYQSLDIATEVIWKNKQYTIANEIDKSNHAKDLRIYFAKKGVSDEV